MNALGAVLIVAVVFGLAIFAVLCVVLLARKESQIGSNEDLKRTDNCQRCGERSKWLYYCTCVHDMDDVKHSLFVVQKAIEARKGEDARSVDVALRMLDTIKSVIR